MAVRITNIKIGGKRIQKQGSADFAKRLRQFLKDECVVADVTISYFYSDRWYDIETYEDLVK